MSRGRAAARAPRLHGPTYWPRCAARPARGRLPRGHRGDWHLPASDTIGSVDPPSVPTYGRSFLLKLLLVALAGRGAADHRACATG